MATIDDMKNRSPEWARELARKSTRGYGMATARMRAKPDYLIIGAKRGGTTSLFKYLRMHPGVLGMFPHAKTIAFPLHVSRLRDATADAVLPASRPALR